MEGEGSQVSREARKSEEPAPETNLTSCNSD